MFPRSFAPQWIARTGVASTEFAGGGAGSTCPAAGRPVNTNALPQQHKGTVVIDVTQPPYNAPADAVTDAQPAIQRAIHAALDNQGGVVYFPAGVYRLARPLTIRPAKNSDPLFQEGAIVLMGAGGPPQEAFGTPPIFPKPGLLTPGRGSRLLFDPLQDAPAFFTVLSATAVTIRGLGIGYTPMPTQAPTPTQTTQTPTDRMTPLPRSARA